MCEKYTEDEEDKKFIEKSKKYYETILNNKIIYTNVRTYFKILGGKNQLKKEIREIVLFHFPLIAYIKFSI